jgi:hypothetical protein
MYYINREVPHFSTANRSTFQPPFTQNAILVRQR